MRLKIISTGMPGPGTKIIDAESGQEIHNVKSVTWSMEAGSVSEATIQLQFVEVEVIGTLIDKE